MNQAEKSQSKHDSSVARARLWRNIFAAAAAAMVAQLVFNLGRPNVLVAMGVIILLLVGGLVLTQLRLRRTLAGSGDS
ncbi:MAG: hypothetical protein H7201_14650 [Candidatus Saccharibacteria bacterium]|nr:hypothetical protein [Microbacteriaceae bacterium]